MFWPVLFGKDFEKKEFVLEAIEFDQGQRILESKCDSVFNSRPFAQQNFSFAFVTERNVILFTSVI